MVLRIAVPDGMSGRPLHATSGKQRLDSGDRRQRLEAIGLITLSGLLFVIMNAIVKALITEHHPVMLIWARYFFHVATVVVLFPWQLGGIIRTPQMGLQFGRSVLLLLSTIANFLALIYLPLGEVEQLAVVVDRLPGEVLPCGLLEVEPARLVGREHDDRVDTEPRRLPAGRRDLAREDVRLGLITLAVVGVLGARDDEPDLVRFDHLGRVIRGVDDVGECEMLRLTSDPFDDGLRDIRLGERLRPFGDGAVERHLEVEP